MPARSSTRTRPTSRARTPRSDGDFAALIAGMESLQLQLCAQVRDGVDYANIHLDAHLRIAGLLHDSGVITMSAADAVGERLISVFFPHGVGHLLGLQVHDVAGFSVDEKGTQKARPQGHPYLRLTRTLEPGFVVTIEPGLYFIDMLLDEARNGAARPSTSTGAASTSSAPTAASASKTTSRAPPASRRISRAPRSRRSR